MISTTYKYFLICLITSLLGFSLASFPLIAQPSGKLFIKNYTITDYGASSQNWDIVQGPDKLIYVANNDGVLQFDGVNWRLISASNNTAVRSLAVDSTGMIYVGAEGDFGYLTPSQSGVVEHKSLLHLVDSSINVAHVWRTHATHQGVYFRTVSALFRYHQGKLSTIEASTRFDRSFEINNDLYIVERNVGIHKVEGNQLVFMKGSEYYAEDRPYLMFPYKNPNQFLVVTRNKGIHIFNPGADIPELRQQPFNVENTVFFDFEQSSVVYAGIALPNNHYAFSSITQGILIMNEEGKTIQHLNQESGLLINMSFALFLDSQNGLWVGLDEGLARYELQSPWKYWDESDGLDSYISNVRYFEGELYISTYNGLYKASPNKFTSINIDDPFILELLDFKNPRDPSDHRLLMACSENIFQMKSNKIEAIAKGVTGLCLFQKKGDPFIVYAGVSRGMRTFRFDNGYWLDLGKIEGITNDVISITEDRQHNIWVVTGGQEVKKLIFSKPNDALPIQIETYGSNKGVIESNHYKVSYISGQVLLGTDKGLLIYNPDSDSFEASNALGETFALGNMGVQAIVPAKGDEVWAASSNNFKGALGHVDMGSGEVNTRPFKQLPKMEISSLYDVDDSVLWIAGENLYRYDIKKGGQQIVDTSFTASVRKVVINGDSLLFGGNHYQYLSNDSIPRLSINQAKEAKFILNYSQNTIELHYAANYFTLSNITQYSYKLENHDEQWSPWTTDTKQRFTDLNNGDYTFRVKAKNIYGDESRIGNFSFTITPPYYKTPWAAVVYILAFIGLIALIVKLYSQRLVKEKKKLELIVAERTEELEEQKTIIEQKNKNTLDSINYAKRILTALHTPHEQLQLFFPNSFVLFKPKDIVSGDFFWMEEVDGKIIIAVVDCTGHGIPGAFMSVIGNAILKEVVNFYKIREPDQILEALNQMVQENLHQDETSNQDGMDLSLAILDSKSQQLYFSGARNPLVCINHETSEVMVYKGNRRSIGGKRQGADKAFNREVINISPNMSFYMYSDGYQDQFGGEDGKIKFTAKRFRQLLLDISSLPMKQQQKQLENELSTWQAESKQIDDILVVGFQIPPMD